MKRTQVDETAPSLTRIVVNTIRGRGLTASAVAAASGVNPSIVHRFLTGERGMTTASLDRVWRALGLKVLEGRGGLR